MFLTNEIAQLSCTGRSSGSLGCRLQNSRTQPLLLSNRIRGLTSHRGLEVVDGRGYVVVNLNGLLRERALATELYPETTLRQELHAELQ